MDIEGSPFRFRVRYRTWGFQNPTNLQWHSKVDPANSRTFLSTCPVGNKSDGARKLLRLKVNREFEQDERSFNLLTG
jgi:hypothetical protein